MSNCTLIKGRPREKIYHQGFRKKNSYPNQITNTLLKSQMAGPNDETTLISRHFVQWLLVLCSRLSHLVVTLWL